MSKYISELTLLFSGLVLLFAVEARAMSEKRNPVAVVELFTSQGCSSCPPADAFLTELSRRDDVITLAYHVDYWNYGGWKDTFGAKRNTDLQRNYAVQGGRARVYTPQIVLNGVEDFVGSDRFDVMAALTERTLPVQVKLDIKGEMLGIRIVGEHVSDNKAVIWLVPFRQHAEVNVKRGENRGKSLLYSSVVQDRQMTGMWAGERSSALVIPVSHIVRGEIDGLAVLLQEISVNGLPGRIIGAASISR